MNGAVEYLAKRLEEKEEMLSNMKPWYDKEEIQTAINGIKSAISSFLNETGQMIA